MIDCVEFMRNLPDKAYYLGSADPPYGLKQNIIKVKSRCRLASTTIKNKFTWDNQIPADIFFSELKRTTIEQVIWGANYFPQIVGTPFKAPRRESYREFIKQHPVGWIIWDKVNGNNDFSDCELAWTSFDRPTEVFYFMWAGMLQGRSMTEGRIMQGDKTKNEVRIHPTQKPIPLYHWTFTTRCEPGKSILGTHMGSRSDQIAAYKLGIDFVGCEVDEVHFFDGERRFKQLTYEPLFLL